ncbi:peptidase M28 [Rufibacter radiotolerans]|uniref:Peptidase M28 n=1 Tax=Rufibacter radiotolerans TaxID=1379910 RepID=A0A0H4VR44_9BACT|nr:M28 family peptidase [Rufibacter radiotolerans]AKQ47838.1 peptidase M28 [Rufibacter radiotolerans]
MKKHLYTLGMAAAFLSACSSSQTPSASGSAGTSTSAMAKVAAAAGTMLADPTKYANTITAADLEKYLRVLASDSLEGRETGERGQKMAADYISKHFKANGLAGPVKTGVNPYYQTFDLEKSSWGDGHVTVGTKKFTMGKDFFVSGASPYQQEEAVQVVFGGYGIDDPKYSDYTNLDVAGKAVVVLSGEPKNAAGQYLISGTDKMSTWSQDIRTKAAAATKKGAKSVLVIMGSTEDEFKQLTSRYAGMLARPSIGFGATPTQPRAASFFISPAMAAALLNTKADQLPKYSASVAKAGKAVASPYKVATNVKIMTARNKQALPTENVLGYIEGTDLKDQLLVVSSHYDHEGIKNGVVYNGANDDGSGTMAVMELAQAFAEAKKNGHGPRRSILFLTVTGEEKGLLGSEYYTDHPVFPLENTVADLNIDMIGRNDKQHEGTFDYIYVIGSDKLSSELHAISENANKTYTNLDLDYTFNDPNDPNRFYYRSDHYNFAKHNIPIAFYFNGVHEDYHQPTDDVDKINFQAAEKVARLVFYTAWDLANRTERIKVDSNKK